MSALGGYLRTQVFPSLPAGAVIVVGGRSAPEPGWFEGGWETVTSSSRWRRCPSASRSRCSPATGCDGARAEALARWSGGLPLALRLGAAAARADVDWRPGEPAAPAAPLPETRRAYAEVFALACVARVVTPALLADVLPESTPRPGCAGWRTALRRRAGRRRDAARARPAPVPRRAVERAPASCAPARAVSLHARGELIDLADLVQDPAIRAGFGWDGSIDHHVPGRSRVTRRSSRARSSSATPGTCSSRATPRAAVRLLDRLHRGRAPAVRDERLERWLAHAPRDRSCGATPSTSRATRARASRRC